MNLRAAAKSKIPKRETALLAINQIYLAVCLILVISYIIAVLTEDEKRRFWGYLVTGTSSNIIIEILIAYIAVVIYAVIRHSTVDKNSNKRLKILALGLLTIPLTFLIPVISLTFLGLNNPLVSLPTSVTIIATSIICAAFGVINIAYGKVWKQPTVKG